MVFEPIPSGADGNINEIFLIKKYTYQDINASTKTASITLTAEEINLIKACKKVIMTINIGANADDSSSTSGYQIWCASNIFDTSVLKSGGNFIARVNHVYNIQTASPLPFVVELRQESSSVKLNFLVSDSYYNDQYSSGKIWFIKFIKLA